MKKMMSRLLTLVSFVLCFSFLSLAIFTDARAQLSKSQILDFVNKDMKSWANDKIVIDALLKQNTDNELISKSEFGVLERKWQREKLKPKKFLLSKILLKDASKYLQFILDKYDGVYTEIVIVDKRGLNAAQSGGSANYWQGGQEFWEKTYGSQLYAPYVSDVLFSDNTQVFQSNVAFMLVHEDLPIGVAYAGIDVEVLERKIQKGEIKY